MLQTGLEVEMTDHVGYKPHAVEGRGSGNSRNGSYPETVTTEIGKVDLQVPLDRNGTFEPVTVRKGNVAWRAWLVTSSRSAGVRSPLTLVWVT